MPIYRVPRVMPATSTFQGTNGLSQVCAVKCLVPATLTFPLPLQLRAHWKGRAVQFEVLVAGTPSADGVFAVKY